MTMTVTTALAPLQLLSTLFVHWLILIIGYTLNSILEKFNNFIQKLADKLSQVEVQKPTYPSIHPCSQPSSYPAHQQSTINNNLSVVRSTLRKTAHKFHLFVTATKKKCTLRQTDRKTNRRTSHWPKISTTLRSNTTIICRKFIYFMCVRPTPTSCRRAIAVIVVHRLNDGITTPPPIHPSIQVGSDMSILTLLTLWHKIWN